jgi:hypothetical protein
VPCPLHDSLQSAAPAVTFRETVIDYLVHGQDIAVPLGRALPMPRDLAVIAADRVWASPRMFHARNRLAGDARGPPGKGRRSPARSARCSCCSPAARPHCRSSRAPESQACANSSRRR